MHVKVYGRAWGAVVVLMCVLVVLFQSARVGIYDEAVVLMSALQVQNGMFPGTDFFSVYGPLQPFVAAGLLSVFDGNLFALRMYYAATVCITLLCLGAALIRPGSATSYAVSVFFLLLGAYAFSELSFPLYPSYLLALFGAAFVFVVARFQNANTAQVVAGLTIFISLLVLLSPMRGFVIVLMLFFAMPFHLQNTGELSLSNAARASSRLILACLLSGALLLAYEAATGGSLRATVDFLISEQIPVYATHRNLPIPTFSQNQDLLVPFYVPAFASVLGAIVYLSGLVRPDRTSAAFQTRLLWLLFFCAALYPSGFVRTDEPHLLPANIFAWAALLLMLTPILERAKWRMLPLSICLLSALLWTNYAFNRLGDHNTLATECSPQDIGQSPMSCLRVGRADFWRDRQAHMADLDGFLAPDERLFVATDRHDRIFAADLTFYFMLNRLPLTRWGHLEPGIQTTREVQTEIIAELGEYISTNGRAVVLIQPAFENDENNQSSISSGVTILDEYLATCEPTMTLGNLDVRSCIEPAQTP
ncbi:hypothetical protein [Gymnodinialimonas hymeniacidonis]|uniref:hypothetical protein n=1 Tax=Gymnodinialimonas hymeniacidonis TaxID=3126508 RepID=UPI0034C5B412